MTARRMHADEFLTHYAKKQKLHIIDLRTHAEAQVESLAGCLSLPVQDLTQAQVVSVLDDAGNEPVYLLCQSGRRADMALDKVDATCHPRLVVLEGGLNAMKAAGAELNLGGRHTIDLERQVRIAAGSLVMLGCVFGTLVHPVLYGVAAFVGAGLTFAGVTNTCGMGMLIARMPWNK